MVYELSKVESLRFGSFVKLINLKIGKSQQKFLMKCHSEEMFNIQKKTIRLVARENYSSSWVYLLVAHGNRVMEYKGILRAYLAEINVRPRPYGREKQKQLRFLWLHYPRDSCGL